MSSLRFARVGTPLGPMWMAETDVGIAACSRSEPIEGVLGPLRRRFPEHELLPIDLDAAWVESAISGGELPAVDLGGLSGFDMKVYTTVRRVGPGETLTYGEVAAIVGTPRAARAVGGAMSRCPLFPAVPCHRVVRAADGWSGWGGDSWLKRRLLRAERAGTSGRT